MVGWHHRLDGHRFGWSLGVGDGQGGLSIRPLGGLWELVMDREACCGSWGHKESDTTE